MYIWVTVIPTTKSSVGLGGNHYILYILLVIKGMHKLQKSRISYLILNAAKNPHIFTYNYKIYDLEF